ncbi:hypothetical protein A5621_25685 [Mycobacterium colombiense]|uniref:hypothetical protein n=1 Tax=Mycobacterium colombiense TaxID=339268 RepID=UPI0007EE0941|nr:hypothetical protein [Mycobacterium colombiense]OBJ27935.1 hypothetical protein A5621_25685 [Mycobacterium colombiense]OBJ38804.1 hypothetical protein A5620_17105 [Mycobacterium colombiense]OBJ76511.1 hypothetical protein A5627_17260 [Mycobacterium colombiense]
MGRKVAIPWHASFSIAAGFLYFFFVLPRWPELMGDTAHTLGTALRIVTGALVALAALPVVFTLLRTRKPELGTPQLALSIRIWSIVAHVLAGVLIIGTAISEIWLSLDAAGRWLFGIYGAAAAIALLGIFAFYLSFVAELPPPPPKPIKAKKPKERRVRRKKGAEAEADETEEAEAAEADEDEAETTEAEAEAAAKTEEAEPAAAPAEVTAETAEPEAAPEPTTEAAPAGDTEEAADEGDESTAKLRNRRPTGKGSHRMRRRRTRAGVALDENADED